MCEQLNNSFHRGRTREYDGRDEMDTLEDRLEEFVATLNDHSLQARRQWGWTGLVKLFYTRLLDDHVQMWTEGAHCADPEMIVSETFTYLFFDYSKPLKAEGVWSLIKTIARRKWMSRLRKEYRRRRVIQDSPDEALAKLADTHAGAVNGVINGKWGQPAFMIHYTICRE